MVFETWETTAGQPETFAELAAAIAHELGHVFGLFHEHQRPDAADHLTFHCENLFGFATVKATIESKVNSKFPTGSNAEERMRLV